MEEAIKNFNKQFEFVPTIENENALPQFDRFVVLGMGGSHLAADILTTLSPVPDVIIHSDYGLPEIAFEELQQRLIIASSYSGNTEEVIDGFLKALDQKLACAVVSVGGRLTEIAREHGVPYVQIPDTGIQPRSALGFNLRALLKIMRKEEILRLTDSLSALRPLAFEEAGKTLAIKLKDFVPVIYSSTKNKSIAYNWKIKFNETGKIPAFFNILPELNHNEMTGFDTQPATKKLSEKFFCILLKDKKDHPQIQKRMEVLEQLYGQRGLTVGSLELTGETPLEKVFASLLLADWAAFYTAKQYGVESEKVPMVEEFKKLIT